MPVSRVRIGISGWRYPPWRGTFYPKDLPQRSELAYASKTLPVIEINGSFYSLQRPESYTKWYAETPKDFVFSIKGPRYITHMRRLREVEKPLANFFASGLFALEEKLGPILWQFPPNFKWDPERMRAFFEMLPQDLAGAALLASDHDAFLKGRVLLTVAKNRPLRYAVEIRHESFADPAFIELLRKHGIALVITESARGWPMLEDVTADFIYMRLHGDEELYKSGYSDKSLTRWARRVAAWSKGGEPRDAQRAGPKLKTDVKKRARDVYCFFDNTDVKLRAPFDAQTLAQKLGIER